MTEDSFGERSSSSVNDSVEQLSDHMSLLSTDQDLPHLPDSRGSPTIDRSRQSSFSSSPRCSKENVNELAKPLIKTLSKQQNQKHLSSQRKPSTLPRTRVLRERQSLGDKSPAVSRPSSARAAGREGGPSLTPRSSSRPGVTPSGGRRKPASAGADRCSPNVNRRKQRKGERGRPLELWEIQQTLGRGDFIEGVINVSSRNNCDSFICAPVNLGRADGHLDWG